MTPLRWAGAVGGLLLLIAAFAFGRSTGIDHERARAAKQAARMAEAARRMAAAADRINGQVSVARRDQAIEQRDIQNEAIRIVERPIYRSSCIDGDGVGLLDRAQRAANRGLAGEPDDDAAAPAADPARR
ncbi:MAG: hypothetical protein U5M50_03885 [Sphingobium sp.]|nr:hypothetical protein [Sphingobium sp.]